MLATVANLAIVVAMCMAVMVGAISTEAPEASPAMADTIAEEEYMAGVAEDERPQLCTPNLEFLHPPLMHGRCGRAPRKKALPGTVHRRRTSRRGRGAPCVPPGGGAVPSNRPAGVRIRELIWICFLCRISEYGLQQIMIKV